MKTILIADDEYALVEALAELLQDDGYRIVSAANGKDALARAEVEKPDLVLTDLMMPIADGRELVRGLRERAEFRATPVVMMSATARSVALLDEQGVVEVSAFLKKPFDWEKLRTVIEGLIGKGGPAD